ncbi:MAG: hypothetical protein KKA73_16725, partial [Chloroflexi bacterium]|nr:hypothetical protein [Chloroflexota bacterium]
WFGTQRGASQGSADGAGWTTYTTADGSLVSDTVNAVAVDEAGHTWFGTMGGVNRRSAGGAWSTYTTANSNLAYNYVNYYRLKGGSLERD